MRIARHGLWALMLVAVAGCSTSEQSASSNPSAQAQSADVQQQAKPEAKKEAQKVAKRPKELPEGMGVLPSKVPEPKDNPTTPEKVELGKMLYFEPALSKSGNVSCNSCHNLADWGVDHQTTSIGHKWQRGPRNAPTVFNAAFWSRQFWDGRAASLEEQAKGPPLNPIEMAMDSEEEIVQRLEKLGYGPYFEKAFGTPEITYDRIAKAIAAFERTLITPNSLFDRWVRGEAELPEAAKRGLKKVVEIGCTNCHTGPLFTNNEFMPFPYGDDPGRKAITGKDEDDHVFRVQSWRNVAMTAPYFHDGSVKTLDEAVRIMARVQLGIELSDADVADIVAFLKTLTGEPPKVTLPVLPRPAGVVPADYRD